MGVRSRLTASSVPPIWCTLEAMITGVGGVGGVPSKSGSLDSKAAAQPSPKIAEPTVFARESSGVACIRMPLMLSAATTSACLPGCSRSDWTASLIKGTPLAQPTPVTWYLSVEGAIS